MTDATTTGDPVTPAFCFIYGGPASRTVWYQFTPAASAIYSFVTCNEAGTFTSLDDPVMVLYTQTSCAAGVGFVACDDDSCGVGALQPTITATLTAGTRYVLLVGEVGTAPPLPGRSSVQIRVTQAGVPANDLCAGVIPVALNIPASGTTVGATNDYTAPAACFTGLGQFGNTSAGRDVVFSFTAPTAGTYKFRQVPGDSTDDVVLYVSSSCPGAPGVVAGCLAAAQRTPAGNGDTEEVVLNLAAAQQVFVFADGVSAAGVGAPFTLEVSRVAIEVEPNDTPAAADIFSISSVQTSRASAPDIEYFQASSANLPGSRLFAFADGTATFSAGVDMRVTTATTTLEYENSIFTLKPGATLAGTPLPPSVPTFISVSQSTISDAVGVYGLVRAGGAGLGGSSAVPEAEPNNTIAQASFGPDGYFSGTLAAPGPSTDVDIFVVPATAGTRLFIALDGDPLRNNTPLNASLELLDLTGKVLAAADNGDGTSNTTPGGTLASTTPFSPAESIVYRIAANGTYYVRVRSGLVSNATNGTGDYLLSISTNLLPGANTGDASVTEGSSGAYAFIPSTLLCFSNKVRENPSFDLTLQNGTAISPGDFLAGASGGVTLPGQCGVLSLQVFGDTTPEPDETVLVNLSNPVNARLERATSVTTILDDDCFTITCPANMTVPMDPGLCSAVVNYPLATGPGCTGVTCTPPPGTAFPPGTTQVVCTPFAGPSCSFLITVNDTQPPAITCPAPAPVPPAPGTCAAIVSFTATATDNCAVAPGSPTCVPASGSSFPVGTTTVTCTAFDTSGNSATCSFPVTVQSADLSLTKVASPAVNVLAGGTLTYTISYANAGPAAAASVTLADALPADTRFVSLAAPAGWVCVTPAVGANGTVTCTKGSVANAETGTFTLMARVCSETACNVVVNNTATISSVCDGATANNSQTASVTVQAQSDLAVTKSHFPEPAPAGGQTTFTITVQNLGPSNDPNAVVTDVLPAGWTVSSVSSPQGPCGGVGTGTATCTFALGAANQCGALPTTATITLVADLPLAAVTAANVVSVADSNCLNDPNVANDGFSDPVTIVQASDVKILKIDTPDPVGAGRTLEYSLAVTNMGPSAAAGVSVVDHLPPTSRFKSVRAPVGWACTAPYPGTPGGDVTCTAPPLILPGLHTIGISVTAPPVCDRNVTIVNTATVATLTPDPDFTNNTVSQPTLVQGKPCFF